jgi:hypothetical protein
MKEKKKEVFSEFINNEKPVDKTQKICIQEK